MSDTPETKPDAAAEEAIRDDESPKSDPSANDPSAGEKLDHDDIEALLNEASQSLAEAAGDETPEQPRPFALDDLQASANAGDRSDISLLDDVEMDLRIELGRTQMRLDEVLRLRSGSVVALDKLAGDPVDVYVNGRLIARGEVLVMNDSFCVRITELVQS